MGKITLLIAGLLTTLLCATSKAQDEAPDYAGLTPQQLEHMLLPPLLNSIEVGSPDTLLLAQPGMLFGDIIPRMNLVSPFKGSDVKTSIFPSGQGSIYVWQMPEPAEVTQCKYIAFVPWDEVYKMYGVEKTFDFRFLDKTDDGDDKPETPEPWVLGSSSINGHSNYGCISCPASAEAFVEMLGAADLLFNREKYEASLQEMSRKQWEYRFLPEVSMYCEPFDYIGGLVSDPDYVAGRMLKARGYRPIFPEGTVKCTPFASDLGYIYVWCLPEPDTDTQCRYIAFVPDMQENRYKIFMQSRSVDAGQNGQDSSLWRLGTFDGTDEIRFSDCGETDPAMDEADFLRKLQEHGCIDTKCEKIPLPIPNPDPVPED